MWTKTTSQRPAHGTVCRVVLSNGEEATMKYISGLWFFGPDYKLYAYFEPEFWRVADSPLPPLPPVK